MSDNPYRPLTAPGDSGITREQEFDAEHAAYLGAWELLYALEELEPDQASALKDIIEESDNFSGSDPTEHLARVRSEMIAWLADRGLMCPQMERAAWTWGRGYGVPYEFNRELPEPDALEVFRRWSVVGDARTLSRKQFFAKVEALYDEFARRAKLQFKVGVPKRELSHFRWLVKRLVSRKSWAQIAEEEAVFGLSEKVIASEARRTALMIGLPFPSRRGPAKGSRHTPRVRRRRPS